MDELFHLDKLYVKELIYLQSISILIIMFPKTKSINIFVSIRKIIKGNVNVIYYDSKDVVPPCLSSISKNNYDTVSPLHTPTKEHDIITDENN